MSDTNVSKSMKYLIATLFLLFAQLAVSRQLKDGCTLIAIGDSRIDNSLSDVHPRDTEFLCQPNGSDARISSGLTHRLELTNEQRRQLEDDMNTGVVVSGETLIHGANMIGNTITISGNTRYGKRQVKPRSQRKKSILVVRVTDKNGLVIGDSAEVVGDNIFGTISDQVNLKSQMFDCSYGEVDITNVYTSPNIDNELSAPGVIDVTIPLDITKFDRVTIHNAVTVAAQSKLGYNFPGQHEQVMYVIERCYVSCGYAAYAYINSWLSVYQSFYYGYAGVQMHEIGHNFGMAHSGGLNGATYTDHSCLMGNPLYSDEIGKMCFNPAKNWAVSWYDDYKIEVDITETGVVQDVEMVGIAEMKVNNNKLPAVMKLETGTNDDYFIAFNRATGMNSQNDEADDEVTIIQTGQNGVYYSQSWLQAHLVEGESFSIGELTITAKKIDISTTPGTAIITLDDGSGGGVCDGLSRKKCKQVADTCAFGASKIFADCMPKQKRHKHDCSVYSFRNQCTKGDHAGLCKFKNKECSHACDGLFKNSCRKKKDSINIAMCKMPKIKNPCKGCQPKSCT